MAASFPDHVMDLRAQVHEWDSVPTPLNHLLILLPPPTPHKLGSSPAPRVRPLLAVSTSPSAPADGKQRTYARSLPPLYLAGVLAAAAAEFDSVLIPRLWCDHVDEQVV